MISLRFAPKAELLINTRHTESLWKRMFASTSLKYICYEANHVFHKLPIRFVPKIEFLIDTMAIWKAYGSVWLFQLA